MSLSQCGSNKKLEKKARVISPVEGGDSNASSPNHSENQAKLDSIKRQEAKKKKR